MDRSMCAHLPPPRDPAPRCSPLSSSSLLLSPPDPTPSIRPTGLWRGTRGPPGASSAGRLIGRPARGDVLEGGWWWAGVNSQGDGYTGLGI